MLPSTARYNVEIIWEDGIPSTISYAGNDRAEAHERAAEDSKIRRVQHAGVIHWNSRCMVESYIRYSQGKRVK